MSAKTTKTGLSAVYLELDVHSQSLSFEFLGAPFSLMEQSYLRGRSAILGCEIDSGYPHSGHENIRVYGDRLTNQEDMLDPSYAPHKVLLDDTYDRKLSSLKLFCKKLHGVGSILTPNGTYNTAYIKLPMKRPIAFMCLP
eukprot:5333762-Amphidinium_carterae.1